MTGTSTYVIERHMKSWNDMKTRKRQRKARHIFQDNFGAISLILHCLWFCRKAPQTPPQLETFCIACLSQTWLTLWGLMRGSAQPVYNGLLVYHCLPFKPFNAQAKNESRLKKKTEAETLAIGVRKGRKRYEERNTTQGHDRPCLLCIHLWSSMLWYLHWSGWCSPENGTKEHEIQGHCGHSKIPGGEAEKEAAVEQVSGRPVARGVAFGFERTCLGCRGTRDTSWRFMSWVMRHSAVQPCKKHQKTTCRRPTSMWLGQNRLFDFVCLALELGIVFFWWRNESRQQLLVTLDGCHFGHFFESEAKITTIPAYKTWSCYAHADNLAMTLHLKQTSIFKMEHGENGEHAISTSQNCDQELQISSCKAKTGSQFLKVCFKDC